MTGFWDGVGKTLAACAVVYGGVVLSGTFGDFLGLPVSIRRLTNSISPQLLVAHYATGPVSATKGYSVPQYVDLPVFSVEFAPGSGLNRSDVLEDFLRALAKVTELPDGTEKRKVTISCNPAEQWMTIRLQNPFEVVRENEIRIDVQMIGNRYPREPTSITFLIRTFWSARTDTPPDDAVVQRIMAFLKPGMIAAARAAAAGTGALTVG